MAKRYKKTTNNELQQSWVDSTLRLSNIKGEL